MSYLTTEDVATRLHLAHDTVRRLCAAQTITATKVGRRWLVAEQDLDGFMAKHRGRKAPPARTDEPKRGRRSVA